MPSTSIPGCKSPHTSPKCFTDGTDVVSLGTLTTAQRPVRRTALLDCSHALLHDDGHGHAFAQALHVQLNAKARARCTVDGDVPVLARIARGSEYSENAVLSGLVGSIWVSSCSGTPHVGGTASTQCSCTTVEHSEL